MENRAKRHIWLGMTVFSLLMMFDTKYLRAPGDYLLQLIGLKAWTGDMGGTHLTVVYFGILFFFSLYKVERDIVNQSKMTWKRVISILVLSLILYSFSVGTVVKMMMSSSETLTSIEYQSEVGHLTFDKDGETFTKFNAEFKLHNHSKEARTFYVDFNSSWRRKDGESNIRVLDLDGKRAVFRLEGGETDTFQLDEMSHVLVDDEKQSHYSTDGILDELILTDMEGSFVILQYDRAYSVKINR